MPSVPEKTVFPIVRVRERPQAPRADPNRRRSDIGAAAIGLKDCTDVTITNNTAIGMDDFVRIEGGVTDLKMSGNIHIPRP